MDDSGDDCFSVIPDASSNSNMIPFTPAAPHPEEGSLGSMLNARPRDDNDNDEEDDHDDPVASITHNLDGLLAVTKDLLGNESSQQDISQSQLSIDTSQSHPNQISQSGRSSHGNDDVEGDQTRRPKKTRSSRRSSDTSKEEKDDLMDGGHKTKSSSSKPRRSNSNKDPVKKERRSGSRRTASSSNKQEGEDATAVKRRSNVNQRMQVAVQMSMSPRESSEGKSSQRAMSGSSHHHHTRKGPDSKALKQVRRSRTMDESLMAEQLDGSNRADTEAAIKPRRKRISRAKSSDASGGMASPKQSSSEHTKVRTRRTSDPVASPRHSATTREQTRRRVGRNLSSDGPISSRASRDGPSRASSDGPSPRAPRMTRQPSRRRIARAHSNVEASAAASNKPIPAKQLLPVRTHLSYSTGSEHNPRRRTSRNNNSNGAPSTEGMVASEHTRRKPRTSGGRRDVASSQIQRALQLQEAKVNALPDDIESEPEESEVEYSSEGEVPEDVEPQGTIGNQPAQPRLSTMLPSMMPLPSMQMPQMQMPQMNLQMNLPKFNFTGEEGAGVGANMAQFVPKFNFGAAAHNAEGGAAAAPGMGANMSQFVPKFNFGHAAAAGGEAGEQGATFFSTMSSFAGPRRPAANGEGEGAAPAHNNAVNFLSTMSSFAPRFPAANNYARQDLEEEEPNSDEDLANQVAQRLNMRKEVPHKEEPVDTTLSSDMSNSEHQDLGQQQQSSMEESSARGDGGIIDQSEHSAAAAPGMNTSSRAQTRQRQRRGFARKSAPAKPNSSTAVSNRRLANSRKQELHDNHFQ